MIELPLTETNRALLATAFDGLKRVDLSVDCAIEGEMGKVYVDRLENPTAFVVEQDEFFCYFAGDPRSPGGRELIQRLPRPRLLMPGSPDWLEVAQEMHADKLIKIHRFSFCPQALSLDFLEHLLHETPVPQIGQESARVQRVDAASAMMPDSLVEFSAFESAEDFVARGIGYCMVLGDQMIGVAFSSLVCSKGIEVSIFVRPRYRRRGVATTLAGHLLIWCLKRNLEPHWDAANTESCKLAEKLGYVRTGSYAAFLLTE